MKPVLIFLFFLIYFPAFAQNILSGKVVDEKNSPVQGASIFLNNTSIGTISNGYGEFQLNYPHGRYELIISSIGYETQNLIINSMLPGANLEIKLKIKAPELETVIINSYEKDGWKKYGKFFLDHFIGTRIESVKCKLLNPEVLRFRMDKPGKTLFVTATEPLQIVNNALGYKLTYDMAGFHYHYPSRYLEFTGYPFFEEMEGSSSQVKKWMRKRKDVYEGSLMHFMRALFRNSWEKEGFNVRKLLKIENEERKRVIAFTSSGLRDNPKFYSTIEKDSAKYYDKVINQPKIFQNLSTIISGDSIAFMVDKQTVGFEFENYLHIFYEHKKPQGIYLKQFPNAPDQMVSEISLTGDNFLELKSNGMFYNSTELLIQGYWAWSEKISAMLPFDYSTSKIN